MRFLTLWMDYWNRQVKKFTIIDVKLAEGTAIAFTLILVKLFPQILTISIWWFVAALLICWVRLWHIVGLNGFAVGFKAIN